MRIVVLSSRGLGRHEEAALAPILADSRYQVVGAVLDDRPRRSRWQKLRFHLARGRGGYVLVMALRRPVPSADAQHWFVSRGVAVIGSANLYSEETVATIRSWAPDLLILAGGFGIIKEPLLGLAPRGLIAFHHGDMRQYRGQPPCFWELYNGERAMGATVQRLDAVLDAGTPIVERTFPIRYADTLAALRERVLAGSTSMLAEAVARIDAGERTEPVTSLGRVYTLPNLRQWMGLHLRVMARRARSALGLAAW